MKLIRLTFSLIIALLVQWLTAQTNAMSPLKEGDAVPEYEFKEILNYETPTAKISDFRGKLLLLDIWAPWCASCIAAFPKMDALQEKFKNKLQVLLVGDDGYPEGRIPAYVKSKEGTNMALKLPVPVIEKQDQFRQLFNWVGMPHVIWISPAGKIIGITGAKEVEAANIERVLNGEKLQFDTKVSPQLIQKEDNFLLNRFPAFAGTNIYGSAFSKYNKYIAHGFAIDDYINDSSGCRYYVVNTPMTILYLYVYSKQKGSPLKSEIEDEKKIIIEQGVTEKFNHFFSEYPDMNSWQADELVKNNLFSYEINLPPLQYTDSEMCRYIINDFDRFFRIKSGIEKRNIKCFALVRTSSEDGLKSKLKENEFPVWNPDYKNITMQGYKIKDLVRQLNNSIDTKLLILDETGYTGKIDIQIPMQGDINTFRHSLNRYDLDLKEVSRDMDMLVLRPANN